MAALLAMVATAGGAGHELVRTQIVTAPPGGVIEINGKNVGASPLFVTLPQDRKGSITGRTVIRALPFAPGQSAVTKEILEKEGKEPVPTRVVLGLEAGAPDPLPAKPKAEPKQGKRL